MAIRTIPFPSAPRWVQDVALDGEVYTLRGRYNVRWDSWVMDIETADGEPILTGIRLVLNLPLFSPHRYDDRLPPGELLVVSPRELDTHDPQRNDIGDDADMRLVYVTADDEVFSAAV